MGGVPGQRQSRAVARSRRTTVDLLEADLERSNAGVSADQRVHIRHRGACARTPFRRASASVCGSAKGSTCARSSPASGGVRRASKSHPKRFWSSGARRSSRTAARAVPDLADPQIFTTRQLVSSGTPLKEHLSRAIRSKLFSMDGSAVTRWTDEQLGHDCVSHLRSSGSFVHFSH